MDIYIYIYIWDVILPIDELIFFQDGQNYQPVLLGEFCSKILLTTQILLRVEFEFMNNVDKTRKL